MSEGSWFSGITSITRAVSRASPEKPGPVSRKDKGKKARGLKQVPQQQSHADDIPYAQPTPGSPREWREGPPKSQLASKSSTF